MLRKLVDAEKALNEKTETNRKLAQFLNDADVRADEARKLLVVTQNVLQMKEQENLKLAEQLKTKEADNESKQTIAELKSHLHSKESELAIVSNEMVTTQRLLAEKEERIEKMNEERLLLFPPTVQCKLKKQLASLHPTNIFICFSYYRESQPIRSKTEHKH